MRLFQCDQCEELSDSMPFELMQVCEEVDDDGEQVVLVLHLCTTQCLSNFAMALALDLPDLPTTGGNP